LKRFKENRKMKAFTLTENGGIENLKLSEVPKPKINADEVLIKVKAISINPIDTIVRQSKSSLFRILGPEKDEGLYADRILVNSNGNDMKQIARLFEEEKIHPHVSERYKFEDLPKAHKQIETGKTLGKVVVVI
jgi:NADPH:quinone reductase-like Zn-dependent oxidoreductase